MEDIGEEDLFSLTLVGNLRRRTGTVKLIAKNVAGEATLEATLSISGSAPTFLENPYTSEVLEGRLPFCCRFSHIELNHCY